MLKIRIIPILTFNGFGLVKTRQFSNPRMIGNPVQAARVYNKRNVDELIFLDIFCSKLNKKINLELVQDVIKECFMPVGIGGGITSIEDIKNLLKIGADKVVLKSHIIENPKFIKESSDFFGSQCISISVDAFFNENEYWIKNNFDKKIKLTNFIKECFENGAGELILNSVDNDGMMNGFDLRLFQTVSCICNLPIVMVGGAGNLTHFEKLFTETSCEAVGASSIFNFTQYTPLDIKMKLAEINKPVRI